MAKRKHEEHENHERWMVSYADFITLLFAFFVVMYSISSVNIGKYRTVSESIKAALNPLANHSGANQMISVGEAKMALQGRNPTDAKEITIRRIRQLTQVIKDKQLKDLVAFVTVVQTINGDIVITIPDRLLFNSGEATVRTEALPFLEGLGGAILEMNRHARVEGHTDNVPIRTAQFPSNWELSAARAVMVVRVLSELYGVPADHLAAVGHADTRPLTDNSDAEQRAKNRRVEVVILEQAPVAPILRSGDESSQSEQSTEDTPQDPSPPGQELSGEKRFRLP
ncbi:MAG: OmpA family protein [Nitrospira sp.]|jgi:chemotaxis protein MotB|nr:OmpA family protein [Nitrospira sp.]MDI3463060.1 Flagellar motor rotation protein MotB [Nitrospira sp.]